MRHHDEPTRRTWFREQSLNVIRDGQHPSGAYIACPNFDTYAYCWLRDGSFVAWSLLQEGEADSTLCFLDWTRRAIEAQTERLGRLEAKAASGVPISGADGLPARYTLEGAVHEDAWPNFQIDGYGTWLWCLAAWVDHKGLDRWPAAFDAAVESSVRYLSHVWNLPNYDCWEENGDKIHPSTLACVWAGVAAVNRLSPRPAWTELADRVRGLVLGSVTGVGRFPKYLGSNAVDASLLWLAVPFGMVDAHHPAMARTAARIADLLGASGGVKRYAEDTYYGGGQWILLTCWLGLYYQAVHRTQDALRLLHWVEARFDAAGRLPEQVAFDLNDPDFLPHWEGIWGSSASPLLWSHAMHLALLQALEKAGEVAGPSR